MTDRLLRAITADGRYRIVGARTTDLVAENRRKHQPGEPAALALARALTAAALVSTFEKDFHRIMLQWKGRGPLGMVHADVRPTGALRAYVHDATPVGDLPTALGPGMFGVVEQDLEGRVTQGSLPLETHEVDVDVEVFLRRSEQVPSVLRVFGGEVEGGPVAGLLIQRLGDAEEEGDPLDPAVRARELDPAMDLEVLMVAAVPELPLRMLSESPLSLGCECSAERIERGVSLLGPDELTEMADLGEVARVTCEFCSQDHVVGIHRLRELAAELRPN
jgi:molecular chaperone Hsp33